MEMQSLGYVSICTHTHRMLFECGGGCGLVCLFVLLSATATTDHSVFSKAVAILSDCNLAAGLRFSTQGVCVRLCVSVCVCCYVFH